MRREQLMEIPRLIAIVTSRKHVLQFDVNQITQPTIAKQLFPRQNISSSLLTSVVLKDPEVIMDPKSQAQQLPDAIKRRRYPIAMTAIVVTITVVGTLYGASLKQNVQVKEVCDSALLLNMSC